jgi:hypothetical protein
MFTNFKQKTKTFKHTYTEKPVERTKSMFTKDMKRGGAREETTKLNQWATGAFVA